MIKILFFLFIISFYSCVDYSEVPIPSYLYIPDISLNTKPGEGTDSQYFKDVWVFVDDVYYGAYEIPVQIPIGASGLKNVQVYAGVRKNGINSNPTRYPMTAPFEIKLDMQPKMVYTIHPVVSYYDYNKFPFIENFDQSHLFTGDLDLDNLTQVTLSLPEEAFEGNNSAGTERAGRLEGQGLPGRHRRQGARQRRRRAGRAGSHRLRADPFRDRPPGRNGRGRTLLTTRRDFGVESCRCKLGLKFFRRAPLGTPEVISFKE